VTARRPHLLVLNQYYRPGVEASANLLADLCESLAETYDVTVVTGRVRGRPELAGDEMVNGVRVLRARSTARDRTRLHYRALNYFTYLGATAARAATLKRPDLVICMTDPPIVGDIALPVARRYRAPLLVISQDIFPETATALGRLSNPVVIGTLRVLVDRYLKRADHIVVIGDRMKERLIAKGTDARKITVIPNWVDTEEIQPAGRSTSWSRENGFAETFTVMHSGNIGHAQNLDSLVRATTLLRDLDNLAVPIIGFGVCLAQVEALAHELDADKVRFLPYQPRATLSESLSAGTIHYLGLTKGLAGLVVPSRIYGVLAAGRPVIAAADADSDTAALVEEVGCGVVVAPDDPEAIATAIRDAHDGRLDLERMGAQGRAYVTASADRRLAIARYRTVIDRFVD
jgi:glycosyltransferase involved in cell wall biosynthesis